MRCRRCGRRDVLMSRWWVCADCVQRIFDGEPAEENVGHLLAVLAGLRERTP